MKKGSQRRAKRVGTLPPANMEVLRLQKDDFPLGKGLCTSMFGGRAPTFLAFSFGTKVGDQLDAEARVGLVPELRLDIDLRHHGNLRGKKERLSFL